MAPQGVRERGTYCGRDCSLWHWSPGSLPGLGPLPCTKATTPRTAVSCETSLKMCEAGAASLVQPRGVGGPRFG